MINSTTEVMTKNTLDYIQVFMDFAVSVRQITSDKTTSTCLPGLAKNPPYQLMIIKLYSYIIELYLKKKPCTTDFL